MPIISTPTPTFIRAPEKGSWIGLGFNKRVIDMLLKDGGIYFLSWSQNWDDYSKFYGDVRLFCDDLMGVDMNFEPKLIPVVVEGPWDPYSLQGQFVTYSPFKSDADVKEYVSAWQDGGAAFPLYMWLARKV